MCDTAKTAHIVLISHCKAPLLVHFFSFRHHVCFVHLDGVLDAVLGANIYFTFQVRDRTTPIWFANLCFAAECENAGDA